jgi:hypothetical protein
MFQRDLFATFLNAEFNVFKKTSRALAGDPKQKTMVDRRAQLAIGIQKAVNLKSPSDAYNLHYSSGGGGGGGTETVPCETARFLCWSLSPVTPSNSIVLSSFVFKFLYKTVNRGV